MPRSRLVEDLTVEELRELLMQKQRMERQARLDHFRRTGRLIVLEPEPVVPGSPAATTEDAGPRDGVETPGTAPAEPPGETAASPGN